VEDDRQMARTSVRAVAALLATPLLAAVAAAPAGAAPDWNFGLPEETQELTCASIGAGPLVGTQTEVGTSTRAGQLVDPQDIPEVGEVFYGGVMIAAVGGCAAKNVIPEIVPPLGVDVAASAANPVRCHYTLPDGSDTQLTEGCPQSPQPGTHGGFSLAPGGTPNNAWTGIGKIPGTPDLARPQLEILYLEVPLRASRPLTGLPGGPTCATRAIQAGPCRREDAGDFLQAAVQVFSTGGAPTLAPAVGLVVQPGGGGGDGGGGGAGSGPAGSPGAQLLTAPRSLRIRSALRGIPITVTVPASNARVTATLSARRLGRIAVTRRSRARAGRLRLRLKPPRSAARRLRRAATLTATLRVTVRAPGARPATASASIRLRR
jgi:hypothetical protein